MARVFKQDLPGEHFNAAELTVSQAAVPGVLSGSVARTGRRVEQSPPA